MKKQFLVACVLVFIAATLIVPASASDVSVYGGFTSFSGVIGGDAIPSFFNGQQHCPDVGCGTIADFAHFTFSTPQSSVDFYNAAYAGGPSDTHNLVAFMPAAPQSVSGPGADFLLGTFVFANGIWTGDADIGLTLTTSSADTSLDGHTFTGLVHMTLTSPNLPTNTPEQNADFFSLEDASGNLLNLPSIRVYELADSPTGSNMGTVDLYGHIGSLDLTKLSNPQGGLFLNNSHGLLTTPEPGSFALIFVGLATTATRRRARK